MERWIKLLAFAWAGLLALAPSAHAEIDLSTPWPPVAETHAVKEREVRFPSYSPFTIADMTRDRSGVSRTRARGRLFLPRSASAATSAPAVVLLHGASGVHRAREVTYARQLAAQGVAALIVEVFGARRDFASGFVDRLIHITEAMFLADAFAGLEYLRERPEIDGGRVVLIGFSYGGMAATYAAYEQVAERFAPNGARFAGHVAFYAPCIVEFRDNRATGAPILMLYGGRDAIVDPERCRRTARALERGGSEVRTIVYDEAVHQWDGSYSGPRPIGRNLAGCHFIVEETGLVRGAWPPIPMTDPTTRQILLWLCTDSEGYLIGRNEDVRRQSNRDLARFLEPIFSR